MNFEKIKEFIKELPEKINNMFNQKKPKEDVLTNDMNKIESELSKIYFDIMNSEEISIYKKELINQKVGLLNLKLENMNINSNKEDYIDLDKEMKKDRIPILIVTLLLLFLPPLGVIALAGYSIYTVIHITKVLKQFNFEDNKNKGMENQLRSMLNTLHNCGVFLTKKHNVWLENQDKNIGNNLIESLEVRVANDLLQEYLSSGYYRKVPTNIENYLVKMLQEDLQTEEVELDKLMEMAKEKTSYENLNEELNLGVNLVRKDKK